MKIKNETNFKTLKELIKFTTKNELSVEFLEMNEFAYSNGKNISINKNLPREAKIFMLAHEIGHILSGNKSNLVDYFSLEFEKEDQFALKALWGIHENEAESFQFQKLFRYPYFKKIEKRFYEMNKKTNDLSK